MKHGTEECQSTIMVQKGIPFDLLLGAGVLAELGFHGGCYLTWANDEVPTRQDLETQS